MPKQMAEYHEWQRIEAVESVLIERGVDPDKAREVAVIVAVEPVDEIIEALGSST